MDSNELDEVRSRTLEHMIMQKKRIAKGINKHVRIKQFAIGNLVCKTILPPNSENDEFSK